MFFRFKCIYSTFNRSFNDLVCLRYVSFVSTEKLNWILWKCRLFISFCLLDCTCLWINYCFSWFCRYHRWSWSWKKNRFVALAVETLSDLMAAINKGTQWNQTSEVYFSLYSFLFFIYKWPIWNVKLFTQIFLRILQCYIGN